LFVETPFANILNEFVRAKTPVENKTSFFYRSQSAKAHLRDKKRKQMSEQEKLLDDPIEDLETEDN
jgi:hypothetical protein